jgi:ubiquinone/menaquinone biosynthesis C-methylase UbiE
MLKILNVGCGNDRYGTHFVDLFPQRKDIIKCDVDKEKLPYSDNIFNEVYSKNLFEHLTNLGFVMKEMYRVLKKRGKLIIITDNANFWGYAFGKTHLGLYEKIEMFGKEDRHYGLFTEWHLQNYARKIGFKSFNTEYIIEDLIGFRGTVVKFTNLIFKNTPLHRIVFNQIKLEAIK